MTLFDGGQRRAATDEAKQNYDFTVANYRQTTLTAFQQVEDNLAALGVLEHDASVQDAAVKAAQRSLDLSITRYRRWRDKLSGSDYGAKPGADRRGYRGEHSWTAHGERRVADSGTWGRMGPIRTAAAAGVLRENR